MGNLKKNMSKKIKTTEILPPEEEIKPKSKYDIEIIKT